MNIKNLHDDVKATLSELCSWIPNNPLMTNEQNVKNVCSCEHCLMPSICEKCNVNRD